MISQYRKPLRMLLSFIRIQIFESVRVVTMILRIVGAVNYTNTLKGNASINESLIIAEQVSLTLWFFLNVGTYPRLLDIAQRWLLDDSVYIDQTHRVPRSARNRRGHTQAKKDGHRRFGPSDYRGNVSIIYISPFLSRSLISSQYIWYHSRHKLLQELDRRKHRKLCPKRQVRLRLYDLRTAAANPPSCIGKSRRSSSSSCSPFSSATTLSYPHDQTCPGRHRSGSSSAPLFS